MAIVQSTFVCLMGLMVIHGLNAPESSQICDVPTTHYEEMGCIPIFDEKNVNCPERYECPDSTFKVTEKCYYKSNSFVDGEPIPKNIIDHDCVEDCKCSVQSGEPVINCANVDCEYDSLLPSLGNKCVKQYKERMCCSFNEICDEEKISELKTCEYNGNVYYEGEQFYPINSKKVCICNDNFDGTLNSCRTINCGVQIFNSDKIHQKCAPVYHESRIECPIEWKCYEPEDSIVRVGNVDPASMLQQMTCLYGDNMLAIGDQIAVDLVCTTCKCNIPPLVTCMQYSC